MITNFLPPPVQKINSAIALQADVEIYVLRLDLIHPWINGNKWFKLKYNLLTAKEQEFTNLLTFGGAYSNHIYATAAAGNLFRLGTIGVIRGEERLPLNPTLDFAVSQGMQLIYLDRQTYRQRETVELHQQLKQQFGEVFIIPEGGCNLDGVKGCTEIITAVLGMKDFNSDFNTICVACGTATTLVGMALSLGQQQKNQRIIGFPVLKGGEFLSGQIKSLSEKYLVTNGNTSVSFLIPWELVCNYHFGGYGKIKPELIQFCHKFADQHGVPLDYIYTGKMFYGVMDLLQKGFFPPGDRLLLVHTGGLQGNFNHKLSSFTNTGETK